MPRFDRLLRAVACALVVLPTLGLTEPAKPPCVRGIIALEDDIDSAHARAADSFRFVTVDDVHLANGTLVPAGSIGFGLVAISQHAERGGRGGYLVIEARFVRLRSGVHIPAAIDWPAATRATATGASMNIPGIVGAIPFMGYVLGPYAFIHHGKDVIIPRGAQLPVVLGDDLAAGTCRLNAPIEHATEPPAAASAEPSPAPAVATSPPSSTAPESPTPATESAPPAPATAPAAPAPAPAPATPSPSPIATATPVTSR